MKKDKPMTITDAQKIIETKNLDDETLCEIYCKMNAWEWDERFAPKPKGWEEMALYNYKLIDKLRRRAAREHYLRGPMIAISMTVTYKDRMKCRFKTKGRSAKEFETWWRIHGREREESDRELINFMIKKYWR